MALKASPDDQALLLDLQALDTKLQQLAHRAKSLPEHAALAVLATQVSGLQLSLAEQRGFVEDARLELSRVESDVELVEIRIKRDAERLQSSSSTKDVAALEQELAALRKRQFDLEEIELSVMERVEAQELSVALVTDELLGVGSQVAALEVARDAGMQTIEAERVNAEANRSAIQARIPADLLALYEKQRSRYGTGASMLRGGVSSASGVKLNENDMVAIRAAAPDDVLMCPDSNAILVRTSESGL
jgi:predicted  nucleic acid-binding Zn-ribbon protein